MAVQIFCSLCDSVLQPQIGVVDLFRPFRPESYLFLNVVASLLRVLMARPPPPLRHRAGTGSASASASGGGGSDTGVNSGTGSGNTIIVRSGTGVI